MTLTLNTVHEAVNRDWLTYNNADLARELKAINSNIAQILSAAKSNSLTNVQGQPLSKDRVISELTILSADVLKILNAVEGLLKTDAWKSKGYADVVNVHGDVISSKSELHQMNLKAAELMQLTGRLQNG